MAAYSAELLRPSVAKIEEQALEIGALRVLLAAATSTNGQGATQSAPPAGARRGAAGGGRCGGELS